jgi:hypothetical protein
MALSVAANKASCYDAKNRFFKEGNMRVISAFVVFAAVAVVGVSKSQEKKGEALSIDAGDLAREFEKNPQQALQKYGTAFQVIGLVININKLKKTLTLETGEKVSVVLQAKRITESDQKSKQRAAQATGKVRRFEKNTVIIECDEAKLLPVVEGKK